MREPSDVKVELERGPIGVVMAVKVLLEEVHYGVNVVVVAGTGEDALVGVVASVHLVPQRIDRHLPQAGEGSRGTLDGSSQVRGLPADTVQLACLRRRRRRRRFVVRLFHHSIETFLLERCFRLAMVLLHIRYITTSTTVPLSATSATAAVA